MSAHSLRSQLETSNIFLEIVTILQGDELECPDQPRPVAAAHRPRPGPAAPRHRGRPGQHRAQRLRHRHRPDRSRLRGEAERRPPQPLPDPGAPPAARTRQPGTCHRRRPGPARGRRRETAADRDRTSRGHRIRPGAPRWTRTTGVLPGPGLPPDEPRRPCHRRAQRRTRHRIRPSRGHLPGLLPRCRQSARHRPVPGELP